MTKRERKTNGRLGGFIAAANMTPEQRMERSRKAVAARRANALKRRGMSITQQRAAQKECLQKEKRAAMLAIQKEKRAARLAIKKEKRAAMLAITRAKAVISRASATKEFAERSMRKARASQAIAATQLARIASANGRSK